MLGTSNNYVDSTPRILKLYVPMYILYQGLVNKSMNK